jgi:protein O-mannosyl-transferase
MSKQWKTALLCMAGVLLGLLLTAWLYWNGLSGGFMLDDGPNIIQAYIANPDWHAIIYTITHNGSGFLGRSVSMASFVLSGLQYGLEPWGYKYHNLLLHLLIGVLLFRLLMLVLPRLDEQLSEDRVLLVAGATTLLWLLHPLQVSTVLYIVQRMAQLANLFILLALLAWIKARTNLYGWRYWVYGWMLFPLCTLLAMLSKEIGALVPVYVLALELLVFRTTVAELRSKLRVGSLVLVFVLLPLVLGTLVLVFKFNSLADYSGREFTMAERLLTQVHVLFFYIRLILLPRIREMSLFHDDYPITTGVDFSTLALLLVLIALMVLAWRIRKSHAVFGFGLAWFLISHLMESTVFPLEQVFEHRNYLALAGLLLIPVHLLLRSAQYKALSLLYPLFLLLFTFQTAARTHEWGNDELFQTIAITEHPGSPRALNSYVNLLLNRGENDKVLELLARQIELRATEAGAHLHLLIVHCDNAEHDNAQLDAARNLLGRHPVSVYSLNGLQVLTKLALEARCPAVNGEQVKALLDTALGFEANQVNRNTHASLLRLRGILALGEGFYAQAYAWFMMSHELTGTIDTLAELLEYQLRAKRLDDAMETLQLMEQQNAARFGIEQYKVNLARKAIDNALLEAANEPATSDVESLDGASEADSLDAATTAG